MCDSEKYDWKDDIFLLTKLSEPTRTPLAVKEKQFGKEITFVVKPKYGKVYRRSCPDWARDVVEKRLSKDDTIERFFEI